LAALLLGTMGGFGTWLAWCGVTWIRGYERISVIIAFLSLAGLALLIDGAMKRWAASGWRWWTACGLLLTLLVLGVLDQTSPRWFPRRDQIREVFEIDREFVHKIEALTPDGSMIFQLPYMIYPEAPRQNLLHSYDLSRGYLHSETLRWSFGAMKGRETAQWQQKIAALPPDEMIHELKTAGFQGVYIDRAGYADRAVALEKELKRLLGKPSVESSQKRMAYYNFGR
jgi:phosphoglycerol transferase